MKQFAHVLSARPNLSAVSKPAVRTTQAVLQDRYKFHMSMLQAFVRHSQCVESQDKKTVSASVNKLANRLTEKYNFGSKFLSDINQYVENQFKMKASTLYTEIQQGSGLSSHVFEQMVDELRSDNTLYGNMSSRFREIFR